MYGTSLQHVPGTVSCGNIEVAYNKNGYLSWKHRVLPYSMYMLQPFIAF